MNDNGVSPTESRTSSNSELEKEISEIDLNKAKAKPILCNNYKNIPTKKARRVRFFRNGDKFYSGFMIPVSSDRYRSFESLTSDLTRILEDNVSLPGAVRSIFTMQGKKIANVDDLEHGKSYVCSCNNEPFKKAEYSHISNHAKTNNKLSRITRPGSPCKNGVSNCPNGRSPTESADVVRPRIVTLIRHGIKPRKIYRLLLNKRNSPTFEHVLQALTQKVHLDSGCVRKVYTLSGIQVQTLGGFFDVDEVFICYGLERVNDGDFELEPDENKAVQGIRKPQRAARNGIKPKMPVKSHNESYAGPVENNKGNESDVKDTPGILPPALANIYSVGKIIGDGNFAVVWNCKNRTTGEEFALKVIDKAMCLGKEHYIDAEIRVMRRLNHPNTVSLIAEQDTTDKMFLVLELVRGGDLFDAIAQATKFSEKQSRVMMRHLGSAMAYLHSLQIVHRDIKPENLLVDIRGDEIITLKLGDFGLACEITGLLHTICGTPTYVAPEILWETGYGMKIDIWAAGVILYIMLCGFPPFVSQDNDQDQLFDAILSGQFDFPEPYWNDVGELVRDLIENMLQSDPDARYSSEDVLEHEWLQLC
uniref:non-specific serine/threonine protein kinase n=1 Tax=Xenopsylla cheopis TaxID=163159 RepID=A0A6M2DC95_XENCH